MSGPKVFQIVTREEVLATCRIALAEVDLAIEQCRRSLTNMEINADQGVADWEQMRNTLQELVGQERFLDVQKRAPQVVDAIHDDVARQCEQHESVRQQRALRAHSLRTTAAGVLERCRKLQAPIWQELQRVLQSPDCTDQELERLTSRGIEILAQTQHDKVSLASTQLAQSLGATGEDLSIDNWLTQAYIRSETPRLKQIQIDLARLAAAGETTVAPIFEARFRDVAAETELSRQNLLADSLLVDIAAEIRTATARSQFLREYLREKAALVAMGTLQACSELVEQIEKQLAAGDHSSAKQSLVMLRERRSTLTAEKSAKWRRETVLRELQRLGYEVREGMEMKWQRERSLLVHHPDRKNVAVELTGTTDNGRTQARVVANSATSVTSEAAKLAEEQWCNDAAVIRERVHQEGGCIEIEKATAAGKIPLKAMAFLIDDSDASEPRIRNQNQRP